MASGRSKGVAAERELVNILKQLGVPAERNSQFKGGGADNPDIETPFKHIAHIEVKRCKKITSALVKSALAQAKKDAPNKPPLIIMRDDNGEWVCLMPLTPMVKLLKKGAAIGDEKD